MLVLGVKVGDRVRIADCLDVVLIRIKSSGERGVVSLGFDGPRDVSVARVRKEKLTAEGK